MKHADPDGSRYAALRLARRLRHAHRQCLAQPPGAPGLTLDALQALHGSASAATLLMLYALVCVLPLGGVGNVFGVALWLLAWQWGRGRPHALPERLARFRLSPRWSAWVLQALAQGYRQAGRWMRPRGSGMLAGWTQPWWAGWIALQALIIFLPIPLGNVLPAMSLVALGLGRLLRDGVVLGVSLALGSLALVYTALLGQAAWVLSLHTFEALRGWLCL